MRDGMLPESTSIRDVVLKQIRDLAAQYGLRKVTLFGSRARGDFKERSDIDLAVSGGDISGFALAVDEETDTNTQTYTDVLDAIETKNVPVTVPVKGQTFQLSDAAVSVIAAQQADDLNNTSIVLKATYEDTSFLFMGDAETEVENAILSAGTNVKSNVLKVGHHGSSTSTSSTFLAAVSPDAAVISCGAGNSYGHPSATTLQKLTGVPVWRTDLNGTIIAMTDDQTCRLTAEKGTASLKPPATTPSAPSEPSVPSTSVDEGGREDGVPSTIHHAQWQTLSL